MSKLLIIGAGGHGQCCHAIAERMKFFNEISFLDDEYKDGVVGKIDDLDKFVHEYEYVFVAIGNNQVRKQLYEKASILGYKLATLIDPLSSVSKYCFIGEGSVVFPSAVLETNCHVSKGCIISSNTTINHDAYVGEYTLIYSNTVIRPRSYVGEMCLIEGGCVISSDITVNANSYIPEGKIVKEGNDF